MILNLFMPTLKTRHTNTEIHQGFFPRNYQVFFSVFPTRLNRLLKNKKFAGPRVLIIWCGGKSINQTGIKPLAVNSSAGEFYIFGLTAMINYKTTRHEKV